MLNAFRHQREDHGWGDLVAVKVRLVLNAFRHQREDHLYATVQSWYCFGGGHKVIHLRRLE